MELPLYQVDAFASKVFEGNPAAVCPLEEWLDDSLLQAIAMENNLSETAFFVKRENDYELRWFTPLAEVDLCGHATLATAFVLKTLLKESSNFFIFQSKSGPLSVSFKDGLYTLDFPTRAGEKLADIAKDLKNANVGNPIEAYQARELMLVYRTEAEVLSLSPDMKELAKLSSLGVIATAPGGKYDFVSRAFFPKIGIDEDPVTGSAHCTTIPYWANALGKNTLKARQVSFRGGDVYCELLGDRCLIGGHAVLYKEGRIILPD